MHVLITLPARTSVTPAFRSSNFPELLGSQQSLSSTLNFMSSTKFDDWRSQQASSHVEASRQNIVRYT